MKKIILFTALIGLLLGCFIFIGCGSSGSSATTTTTAAATTSTTTTSTTTTTSADFSLTSSAFSSGGLIPQDYAYTETGIDGNNYSLPLAWSNAPATAESFVITMVDTTMSTAGDTYYHWVVIDLPSTEVSLTARDSSTTGNLDNMPAGSKEIKNNISNLTGYEGPWPLGGAATHTYTITIYALNVATVSLTPSTAITDALFDGAVTNAKIIDSTTYAGIYTRP